MAAQSGHTSAQEDDAVVQRQRQEAIWAAEEEEERLRDPEVYAEAEAEWNADDGHSATSLERATDCVANGQQDTLWPDEPAPV